MKPLASLGAMLIAASSTAAFAQGDSATKPGTGLDADANPSALHKPAAGNPAGAPWAGHGPSHMKSSRVAGRRFVQDPSHRRRMSH
jgi:hypothetical protein